MFETRTTKFSPGLPITDFSISVLLALLKKANVSKSSSKGKNGLFPAVEFLLEMTAKPSITGHLGIFSCSSWKRTFTVKLQYHTPKKIRLTVQSFSVLLFDILECHYSRMKDVLAIQQEQKYKRHRPETTLLYQLVESYCPEFTTNLAERGKYLPKYVERELMNSTYKEALTLARDIKETS